ncbi:MAG TPA: hypothetical protein DDY13_11280 [Cytophagales bacterium]|jgi:hypothetical protein|nr:hypothetical protein [Cytophagales bacterium]
MKWLIICLVCSVSWHSARCQIKLNRSELNQSDSVWNLSDSCFYWNPKEHQNDRTPVKLHHKKVCLVLTEQKQLVGTANILIQNQKDSDLASFEVDIEYGVNHIEIDWEKYGANLIEDETYNFLVYTNNKLVVNKPFIYKSPKPDEQPEVNIEVKIIQSNCDMASQNTALFIGKVTGGKAPYEVSWMVVEKNSYGKMLYKPLKTVLPSAKDVHKIEVNALPGYYVSFKAKDACGQVSRGVIDFFCSKDGSNDITFSFQKVKTDKDAHYGD